jgi:Tfp pilus assembly protein PilW
MKHPGRHQRGETLTGLLVGMALGLLVLSAGTQMLGHLLRGHRLALQDSHLQQDLHFAMDLMVRELQSAHYVANAWHSRHPTACEDDFCLAGNFLLADNRIDFSMDKSANGQRENNECTGFKVTDSALLVRTSCSNTWQPLTDKTTAVVTALQAQLRCTEVNGWLQRQMRLQLDAHAPGDATRHWPLSRSVVLRNPVPASHRALFCP